VESGQELRGKEEVSVFEVPEGITAFVAEDFSVHATDRIVIAGKLRARDRGGNGPAYGPEIRLVCDGEITVTGAILGGRGRSLPQGADSALIGVQGGRGSTILIDSPRTLIDGQVQAGPGGKSGPEPKGAQGGAVVLGRGFFTTGPADVPTVFGGAGGLGGDNLPTSGGGSRGEDGGPVGTLGKERTVPAVRAARASIRARWARQESTVARERARPGWMARTEPTATTGSRNQKIGPAWSRAAGIEGSRHRPAEPAWRVGARCLARVAVP